MKKYYVVFLVLATLVSCGPGKTGGGAETPVTPTPVVNAPITSKFEAIGQGLHGIQSFDFSNITLNQEQNEIIGCNGSFGNSGQVNGVNEGKVLFTETTIQFGHLAYVGASNSLCRDISKESYTYTITENVLELCMVNYNFCAQYQVVE